MKMQEKAYTDQYMMRFPDGWRSWIKSTAVKNHRSMNAEILAALERAYGPALTMAGGELGRDTPAIGPTTAALQGGASITQG